MTKYLNEFTEKLKLLKELNKHITNEKIGETFLKKYSKILETILFKIFDELRERKLRKPSDHLDKSLPSLVDKNDDLFNH